MRDILEQLRVRYNRRAFVSPDPLQFVYNYELPADREVAAFIASCLAFGNVKQILRSVEAVLDRMPEPAAFVRESSRASLRKTLSGFKHRYVAGPELADVLYGAGRVLRRWGSMGACFESMMEPSDETVVGALTRFTRVLREGSGGRSYLVPSPSDGSACKRLNLFLRWMVRHDEVDPGGWRVAPAKLVVPLDTHMHRIARALGLTRRRPANLRTALEVTAAFRAWAPEDPVRYDFALTRLGIRSDTDLESFLEECGRSRFADVGERAWPAIANL